MQEFYRVKINTYVNVGRYEPVGQKPLGVWNTARQGCRPGEIDDLTRSPDEPQRPILGVGDGLRLGVQPALSAAVQTPPLVVGSPFLPVALCRATRLMIRIGAHGRDGGSA